MVRKLGAFLKDSGELDPSVPLNEHGKQLYAKKGCNACHSTGSDKFVGPGQLGIYERAATRSEYSSPEDYIESSIRYPAEYIVEGFTNLMPTTWEDAEKQEIADIIEYLKTLK